MGDNVGGGEGKDENGNNLESALAIFRVNAATNAVSGISDDNNATGNTGNGSWVHPDGRAFVFDANGRLLTSTDSGLYARTNPQSSTGVWQGLQGNLSVMEFYALAYDSNSKRSSSRRKTTARLINQHRGARVSMLSAEATASTPSLTTSLWEVKARSSSRRRIYFLSV